LNQFEAIAASRLPGKAGSRPLSPSRDLSGFDLCLENAFAVSADAFSPQGVRSVGRRVFDNLILQASVNASRVSWATLFHPQGWPSGPKKLKPNMESTRMQRRTARGSRPAVGFVFSTRPPSPNWVRIVKNLMQI